jgi:hypothetical protein
MPPAPPDPSVGRASGPLGAARLVRKSRSPALEVRPGRRFEAQRNQAGPVSKSSALEALLVDLGPQINRAARIAPEETAETLRFCSTGFPSLDVRLGGGFPFGRLCEICGPPSSGRTSLALGLLTERLQRGGLAAWIDLADAFDPVSAVAAGSDLERLLWVRARSEEEALRSCERLLQTEGFELIFFDLAFPEAPREAHPKAQRRVPNPSARNERKGTIRDVSWLRLARLAASTRTTLIALSNASATGSRAELVLEMKPHRARFIGPPSLLDALETTAILRRHRSRPTGQAVSLSIDLDPVHSDPTPVESEPR